MLNRASLSRPSFGPVTLLVTSTDEFATFDLIGSRLKARGANKDWLKTHETKWLNDCTCCESSLCKLIDGDQCIVIVYLAFVKTSLGEGGGGRGGGLL